jgi:hypothetical protein
MLSFVKTGQFNRLREKKMNARINIWLRMPGKSATATCCVGCCSNSLPCISPYAVTSVFGIAGLVLVAAIMFACQVHGMTRVHWVATLMCVALAAGNGIFYMQQVGGESNI